MKRLTVCLITLCCCLISTSFAQNQWVKYWLPGEYHIELTEDDKVRFIELLELMNHNTKESSLRKGIESFTVEEWYNEYLQIADNQVECVFDDVGTYIWALGLPDENTIDKTMAFMIACKVLEEQESVDLSSLAYYYPDYTFLTSYKKPAWQVTLLDCSSDINPTGPNYSILIYEDGDVGGYRYGLFLV